MSAATLTPTAVARPSIAHRAGRIDNRAAYGSFAFAYLVGHGAAAVSHGAAPLVDLPGWLPATLLATGLLAGTIAATIAATRGQRGAPEAEARAGRLLGLAWVTGFTALFLAITGLANTHGSPELQAVLWPTGSALVVGLIYLAEGAARRNTLHYVLGTWLALTATASLLLSTPGLYWTLALAGGGAYALATALETRRLASQP